MLSFRVPAITCRDCVRKISGRVSDVPGVRTVEVDLVAGVVRVTGDAEPAAVRAAIASAGYRVTDLDGVGEGAGTSNHPRQTEGDPR